MRRRGAKSVRCLLINRTKGAVSNITKGSYRLCFSQKELHAIVSVLICVVLARGKAPSRRSCRLLLYMILPDRGQRL